MTIRRQLLLLLLIHLALGLAAWDGYQIGLKRGRAERPRGGTGIVEGGPVELPPDWEKGKIIAKGTIQWCGDWRDKVDYHISDAVRNPDTDIIYIAVANNKSVKPKEVMTSPWIVVSRPTPPLPPERTDANWRGN